jgi:beta-phosphoglucomutase-like phosphatase (HAD superfamily)
MPVIERHFVKAVIFDIDGTLVDSFEAYYKVFNEGVADFHVAPISRDILRGYLAKGWVCERFFKECLNHLWMIIPTKNVGKKS